MSTTRWVLIAVIIISASIYWKWETDRSKNRVATRNSINTDSGITESTSVASVELETIEDRKILGLEAAKRTNKYAGLFDSIGEVFHILNLVGGGLSILVVLLIPIDSTIKVVSILGLLVLMGLVYVQTSLIRGLASYFQMKANDHIIRNWDK
ncbi:hypothetical protein MCEMZLE2_00139 [Candidatus Nanopelagicaceae bacterium]